MNFEKTESLEQEKKPETIEEWIKFYTDIETEKRNDIKEKAIYYFENSDDGKRINEKIIINSQFNNDSDNSLRITLHELRHKNQWEAKDNKKNLEFFDANQINELLKDLHVSSEFIDNIPEKVKENARELDAVFFSEILNGAIQKNLLTEKEIGGLLNKNSTDIIKIIKEKI
ncbi:MAG: hypothetical protein PHI45_00700 [Candidatus Pacebacteria bacterium]|nr:hypothetical protein [Candidatus Paceibacterota bacterium]MDD5012999.1 hypothetical protein [Candidatus Paceibacterota bacterium]MDD5752597.1 hypothetical protein [Candidatus Paceibacterota bacterium]